MEQTKTEKKRDTYPLTDSQMGIYLEWVEAPGSTMYNIPMCCGLPDDIDLDRFRDAVGQAVAGHMAFAVNIRLDEGTPVMFLRPEFQKAVIEEREVADMETAKGEFVRPFPLEGEPLYRLALYRCKNSLYFLFDIHHLICDGTSISILMDEISGIYRGETLKPEDLSPVDMAACEEHLKDTPEYMAAKEYFRAGYEGEDIEDTLIRDYRGTGDCQSSTIRHRLGETISVAAVEQFVGQAGITPNTLFLGAFAYALGKCGGGSRSFFCSVSNGRYAGGTRNEELARSVGMFVRTLPVACSWDEHTLVRDFLQGVHEKFSMLRKHDCISFAELAKDYGIASDILFVYQGELFKGLTFEGRHYAIRPIARNEVQADISMSVMKDGEGYEISLEYRNSLFRAESARGLIRMTQQVLLGMLSCERLEEIALSSESDLEALDRFNGTEAEFDRSKTVIDLFREQAKALPEHTAVVYCDKKYTYAQLDQVTDALAAHLVKKGIGREDVVAVLIPRCEFMAIASIGISKAGAAYQPLDPTYPKDRLEFMLADADAKLLIADESLSGLVSGFQGEILLTQDIPSLPAAGEIPKGPETADLFILLYTSGTTGTPKGCMIEHRNIAAFCHWYRGYFGMTPESRAAAYASYGFDAHMMDLYPALTAGGQAHIIEEAIRLDLNALNGYFTEQGITHSFMTTQIGRAFATGVEHATLQYLSMGGEALVPFAPKGATKCHNVYGPTEATVLTTFYQIKEQEEDVPIGRPLSNMKLYILDSAGRRVPVGVPGELCIAGYQVSRGYLNRPEKTAEVYTANPFCDVEGYERIYHTGDVARFLPDGNIQFIGRRDGQVKVRGFRIELTEVEEIIRRFPGIQDATVAAFDDPSGGKYIAAYVVAEGPVDVDAMNAFIEESKPPYMVPAVTMQIERIPLNQNQKVDRRALPRPERRQAQEEMVAPQSALQQQIFDCVAEALGHKEFGITTSFSHAGLTSIGAVKLNALLSSAIEGAVVRNKDFKEYNTVEKLEGFLLKGMEKGAGAFARQEAYPLTQTQSGIFVECAANPGSTVYNIPFLFRLGPGVDLCRLKKAVEDTVAAHPYVKTTLYMDEQGDIWQKRNDGEPFEVEIEQEFDMDQLVRPYTLPGDRLFRAALYETKDAKYLFLDMHHIISDGTSFSIFIRDMNRAYGGETLEAEAFSGFEAALLEQQARQGVEYRRAKEHYDRIFSGCDADCQLAADRREHPGQALTAGYYRRRVAMDQGALAAFCEARQITLNTLFTAVFGFVIGRYACKEEAVFAAIYNGRNDSRLAGIISMLVKTFPVYCNIDGEREIDSYLRETGEQMSASMDADIYSFAEISRSYGIRADTLFAFQGDAFWFEEIAGEPAASEELTSETAKAALSVDVMVKGGDIHYQVEYGKERYEERTIAGLVDSFATAVEEFLQKKYLKEISMVSEEARSELDSYNGTDCPVEQVTANVLFERQAALCPDRAAVIANGQMRTFGQLNEHANKVAHGLLARGLSAEQMVGVMMPRTVDAYAVRQGIMKAGGAFVPLDPEYPDERIAYIMEDSGAKFLVMPGRLIPERSALTGSLDPSVTILAAEEILIMEGNTGNPGIHIRPEHLCYCIYTSGSTGKPKGVMVEHRNLVNYVDDNIFNRESRTYVQNSTVSLALAALTFDVSILEECIPLYHGITVCMANEEEIHNPLALSQLILANGVDSMTCTPSFLTNIIDMPELAEALARIRFFNVGAEAFPDALYGKIMALGSNPLVFNGYGPTETTIGCAFEQVEGGKITIGRPMANIRMMIIDKYRNLLPAGAMGELLIIGNGVGRGYVGRPDLTAEKFISFEGRRAYRSGDLAKWNHHGKIEFAGRMDNQVKLRGLRVELDEIENVINRYPAVKSSVVIVKGEGSEQFLCGYFVAEERIDIAGLTDFMKQYLALYMVPGALMQLEALPLTNNGKIDRKALPEPVLTEAQRTGRAPANELEQKFCGMFAMALGRESIFADDDFFLLGGTSLSASRIAMRCMTEHINVAYADVFVYTTPEKMAAYVSGMAAAQKAQGSQPLAAQGDGEQPGGREPLYDVLQYNAIAHAGEITGGDIGNVLVTGATGFLGIHVVRELLKDSSRTIYCLVRKGHAPSPADRLKTMLMYYFDHTFEKEMGRRLIPIDGDITDANLKNTLAGCDFDTLINCAACVKHFASDDILERVNVRGVEHLIEICMERGKRLVQISTVSVAGESVEGHIPEEFKLTENRLDFGQNLDNQYALTKFLAEQAVLEAVRKGLKGRIVRVGNLMSRESDGEFQINYRTNAFMKSLHAYSILGCYPVGSLDVVAEFSPIDCTAKAVVLLAGTPDQFTVFHAYNCHHVHMANVIEAMAQDGIDIRVVEDAVFEDRFQQMLGDESINMEISGLIAYMNSGTNSRKEVGCDNSFTVKALYRLGFAWPLTAEKYMYQAVKALSTLGFFDA